MIIQRLLHMVCFTLWLVAAVAPVSAAVPCTPFEGGRVDAQILATMRQAAKEGRLYLVDADVSKVGFCVRHFPFQEFRGEFRSIVGGLAMPPDPAHYGQALLLIHTASLQSGNEALVPLAKSRDFMDAADYPEILFVGRRFEWIDMAKARIYGELTLRGRTQPVVFNVELDSPDDTLPGQAGRIRMRGTSQVNRFSFDMRSYRYFVSETIRLCLAVELVPWGN